VTTTEAEFQQQVVELAGMLGWQHLHVRRSIGKGSRWVTATNVVGWPDLFCWHPTRGVVAIELKSQAGQPTPEQLRVLETLRTAGVPSFVWRPSDWDEITSVLAGTAKGADAIRKATP